MAGAERDRHRGAGGEPKKLIEDGEEFFLWRLAHDLGVSRATIGMLPSSEITGWIAYYQVMDWLRKSEKDDPKQALDFVRAVHELVSEKELGLR